MLRDLGWNSVLSKLLADRAVKSFRGRTVVAPDVEDNRVIELPLFFDLGNDTTRVVVGVFGVGIFVGGTFVVNFLLEDIVMPWFVVTVLLLLTEGAALLLAWLAVRNNWGWHR